MSKEKNDSTLKIFAFIIAVVLWSYVMSEVNPVISKDYKTIDLVYKNVATLDRQGLVIMEPENVTVSVKVSGKKSEMAKFSSEFSSESIKAEVDLKGYGEGQKKVPISVSLDQFSNIKIVSFEPREVLFTFDKSITKEKSVTIKTTGDLDPGYVLGDLGTKSQTILLKGPRSWVNEVSEVVAVVDLKNRKQDGSVTVPVRLLDDQGNDVEGVQKEPNVVDVNIPIMRSTKLPIELQMENNLPDDHGLTQVTINPSTIGIKGDKDIFNLTSIKTKPIDVNDLIGKTEFDVELDLPENVQLLDPNEKVKITFKIEESYTRTFSYRLDELEIKNLANYLFIENDSDLRNISIVLKGNKEDIEGMTKEDLSLYIDLNGLEEGVHQVYVNYNLPVGAIAKEIIPQPIELKLNKE